METEHRAMGPEVGRFMGMSLAFSLGCAGGWLLIKLGFLAWAALHLRSPAIAALFGGPMVPNARGD
jgi:hypothetical protein